MGSPWPMLGPCLLRCCAWAQCITHPHATVECTPDASDMCNGPAVQRMDLALAVGECYAALGTEEVSLAEIIHGRLSQQEAQPRVRNRQEGTPSTTQGPAAAAAPKEQRCLPAKVRLLWACSAPGSDRKQARAASVYRGCAVLWMGTRFCRRHQSLPRASCARDGLWVNTGT